MPPIDLGLEIELGVYCIQLSCFGTLREPGKDEKVGEAIHGFFESLRRAGEMVVGRGLRCIGVRSAGVVGKELGVLRLARIPICSLEEHML